MKNKPLIYIVLTALVTLLMFQAPRLSNAADDFEVNYRLMKFFKDKHMSDGMMFLSVTNWTEETAKNVELSIVSPFGFRSEPGIVQLRPIKPGKSVKQKVNFIFSTPTELGAGDLLEEGIVFKVTYTDSFGDKREITIIGEHK